MFDDFENKVILITGAANGLGRSLAFRFARANAKLVLADMDMDKGKRLTEQLLESGVDASFVRMDLRKTEELAGILMGIFSAHGTIDVLINNVRSGVRTEPLKEEIDNYNEVMSASLRGSYFLSQMFVDEFPKDGKGAAIVNVSSVASQTICGESAAYHMAKSGIDQMTRYLAVHAGRKNIRVNGVRPGFIVRERDQKRFFSEENGGFRQQADEAHPLGRVGSADDVTGAIMFLASSAAKFITGQLLTVDGGLTLQDPYYLLARQTN